MLFFFLLLFFLLNKYKCGSLLLCIYCIFERNHKCSVQTTSNKSMFSLLPINIYMKLLSISRIFHTFIKGALDYSLWCHHVNMYACVLMCVRFTLFSCKFQFYRIYIFTVHNVLILLRKYMYSKKKIHININVEPNRNSRKK